MKFGPVPISEAEGSILAHSVTADGTKFRKGQVLGAEEVAALRAAGTNELVVARLEEGDLHEDEAAAQLATALVPDAQAAGLRVTQPFTGRVNLIADAPGVVRLDVEALHRFNAIHPMITVATVPAFQQVGPGAMVATIKIISYSVPQADVARAAATAPAALRLTRPIYGSAGLVVTDIPVDQTIPRALPRSPHGSNRWGWIWPRSSPCPMKPRYWRRHWAGLKAISR